MKDRQSFLLALLACASLMGSSAFAALNSYTGPVNGDWNTSSNWSAGVVPVSGQQPMVSSGSSVLLSNSTIDITGVTLSIGTYMANNAGTGSVTIQNSNATFGYLNMAYATADGTSGVSGLYVNNSLVTFSSTVNVGRGNGSAGAESAELIVDATSKLNAVTSAGVGNLFNVGRGTTGTLALLGNDTSGAQATVGRLILGVETNGVGIGIMGTNSKLVATRSVSVGNTVSAGNSYLTMSGATLVAGDGSEPTQTNSLIVYNTGTLVATNSSISAYNNMTIQTGSATIHGSSLSLGATGGSGNLLMSGGNLSLGSTTVSMAGHLQATNSSVIAATSSSLSVGSNATLSSATLNLNQSSVSITGTLATSNSSTVALTSSTLSVTGKLLSSNSSNIQLTNSTLSVGDSLTATSSATATLGTAIVLSGSHLIANAFSLGLDTDAVATGARNSLTMTNSMLSVTGDATLTYAGLSMDNSTITAGGRFVSRAGGTWNVISNSTISAASMEFSFTANSATISNTVITLSTTSAIAPLGANGYSAAFYLKDGSSIYIGTYGVLGAGNVYLGANSTTASLTAIGGIIRTNSLNSTNSTISLANNTYTLAGNLSATNSAVALTNSTILISTASNLSGSSLGMNNSSISIASTFNAINGVAISLVNSTLSIGTSLTSGITADSAGGTRINATDSTISAGTIVFAGVSSASSSYRHAINLTNSSLQVSTLASLGYTPLTMYNSTLTVGTNLFLQSDSANTIQNSTISSGGFEANFNNNTISMIGSVMTLSSTVSGAPVLANRTYTTRMYARDNTSIAVGDNGYLGVGYLYLGSSGVASLSMTGGATSVSNAIYVGAASGGTGYLSVAGGTATASKTLSIGGSGAGTVSVSGTGVLYSPVLIMSGNATLSGNVYIQGAQATPITAAGQATFDTMKLGSGAVLTGGTVHIAAAASVSFALSGTPGTFQSVKIQSLAFDGASTINVDFTNIAITEATEIVILLADTVSGLEYNPPINTLGLDSAWQALYEGRTIGGQTALVAMITAVPEPAVTALVAGALALLVVVRRRR